MEIWSFQVIYLLSLTSRGAGRDVDGEGEAEVGSSGVTSGGGDGRGRRGLSEPLPHHGYVRHGPDMPKQ